MLYYNVFTTELGQNSGNGFLEVQKKGPTNDLDVGSLNGIARDDEAK